MSKQIEFTECQGCGDEISIGEAEHHGGYCRNCHADIKEAQLDRIEQERLHNLRDEESRRRRRRN